MHSDARELPDGTELDADLCIIGAGAAGITIAREFAGTSHRVVLLEGGGFNPDSSVQALYGGESTGLPYFPLQGTRLRFFGGSTNHWRGACGVLDPIDFEERDWVPLSGWPIDRGELLPYYRRAHPICDLGPCRYEAEYWADQSNQFVPFPLDASQVRTKVMQSSAPTRFGRKYRHVITNAPNITLWTHANVTNLRTEGQGATVRDLRVQCLNGKEHRVRAENVTLACGGLENPRLLLNSNDEIPSGLGNDHDVVGRYFMEHPHVNSGTLRLTNGHPDDFYDNKHEAFGLLALGGKKQREEQVLNYSAFLVPRYTGSRAEFYLRHALDRTGLLTNPTPEFTLNTRLEQCPNPDSRVQLSEETDALGQPRIQLHWDLTDLEKRTIRVANETIAREFGRHGVGRVQLMDWVLDDGKSWPSHLKGGHHHMGTTRMSDTPRRGVVDSDCRVHGVDNLYVAGSSVYPTSGVANPTLTLVALALRLSDHLKDELG